MRLDLKGLVTAVLLLVMAGVTARAAECDGSLVGLKGPDGYKTRSADPRCEGLFISPVSGPPIEIVSFTRGRLDYDPHHTDRLAISLATPQPDGPVHVRAVGIPATLYYRMDADLPSGRPLVWPLRDVIGHDGLTRDQVGVFAFTRTTGGAMVYLPLSVTAPDLQPAPSAQLSVVLRPLVSMSNPQVTLKQADKALPVHFTEMADRLTADFAADQTGGATIEVTWTDGNGMRRVRQFAVML